MPQHRALPDFVSKNHLRTNFYDDEKNAPVIVEGLKFMNKVDPALIKSIPLARDVLRESLRKEQRSTVAKSKRVNVFALDEEDDEADQDSHQPEDSMDDHDIFGSDPNLAAGMAYIRSSGGRRVTVPKKISMK